MRSLVDDFRTGGRSIDLQIRSVSDPVPPDIAGTLYRITQEALHNARKHAMGAPVFVVLQQNSNEFRLTVKDAGPGFNPDQVRARGGLGLLSMRERARLAGGSLLLRSAIGKGTVLIARVPAEKRVAAARSSEEANDPGESVAEESGGTVRWSEIASRRATEAQSSFG